MNATINIAQQLEELSANAWPALQQICYDGWMLRFAEGYARRGNSISPLYPGVLDIAEKIACCEVLYRRRGLRTIFKISPAVSPQLDELLAARGYVLQAPTEVQTVNLCDLDLPENVDVELREELTADWLAGVVAISAARSEEQAIHRRILENISVPLCTALIRSAGEVVACGLGVRERGYVGLFDIATAQAQRRRGYARQLITGILRWARLHDAEQSYLQVMADNTPALALYAKLGYQRRYTYWYRVKE